jgi:carbamoylphosphate synthase large subunit
MDKQEMQIRSAMALGLTKEWLADKNNQEALSKFAQELVIIGMAFALSRRTVKAAKAGDYAKANYHATRWIGFALIQGVHRLNKNLQNQRPVVNYNVRALE